MVGFTARITSTGREFRVRIEPVLLHDGERQCELALVRLVALLSVVEQALAVEGHERATDAGLVGAVGAHRDGTQARDPRAGRARADEDHSLLGHAFLGDAKSRQDAGHAHAGGPLNVVVERRHAAPIALEQSEGAIFVEVFPLNDRPGKYLSHAADERLDEVVVVAAAKSLLGIAEVERVGEEGGVVRADVEADGQAFRGMDPGASDVERKLADRDAHATAALIAETEDAFVVSGHDQPDVPEGRVPENGRDLVHVVRSDPEPARRAIDAAELLARLTDGRRVNDGHQLRDVVDQHPIEEDLVAIVQARETDVALERALLGAVLVDGGERLLREGGDSVGHHAAQTKLLALSTVERRALIGGWIVQQPDARFASFDDFWPSQIVEWIAHRILRCGA